MGTQPKPVQETLRKVDQAMARLQEIQCTISGGSISCGGVNLSPRSTRGYLRTSLRCKQESLRLKELAMKIDGETNLDQGQHVERSSSLRRSSSNGEWRRWSLPAFLIQQAVGEIIDASNTAKEVACLFSESTKDKPMGSPKAPQTRLNEEPLEESWDGRGWEEQGSYSKVKCVPNEIGRQYLNTGEKARLQKFGYTKTETPVCKFKVIGKDASSTLNYHRKIEKEHSASTRAESPKLGMRIQRQMSFKASDQARKGGIENLLSSLPDLHCSSLAKYINDENSAKPVMKVEQIRPAHKAWMSRSSSTKAIMFPNPAFVSSPLKNSQKVESTNVSMRRKSLTSLKGLTSSKNPIRSPCHEEKESAICMIHNSPLLIKSSSFSEPYGTHASKLTRQSSVSMQLNKTLKKFHVIKASPLATSQPPSTHEAKVIPSLGRSESLRLVSSSQAQGFLPRRHSMSSCDQPKNRKVCLVPKKLFESLFQPSKKRNSGLMHPEPRPEGENVANESIVMKGAETEHKKTDFMPSGRRQTQTSDPIANDFRKKGAYWIDDHSLRSSLPIMENISVNEMKYQSNVQECKSTLYSPKQRLLRPIAINCAHDSIGRPESNMNASEEKQNKRKIKLQRKEDKDNEKEDGGKHDRLTKKSSGFLRKSWSFRRDNVRLSNNEKLESGKGGFPFLKNVKEWMSLQRSGRKFNR